VLAKVRKLVELYHMRGG
jgi:hypothetical protein